VEPEVAQRGELGSVGGNPQGIEEEDCAGALRQRQRLGEPSGGWIGSSTGYGVDRLARALLTVGFPPFISTVR
jgi:hypothetical protein